MAERAANGGMRIARATGIQAEMEMDFAGLHQLLLPFIGGLPDLPGPQRAALEMVFGLAAGQVANRFLVGLATLTLLTNAAEEQPVLCVVDDAQWLDRVGIVFGLRDGEEHVAALSGLPELNVGPLPPEAGKELLEAAAGGRVAELTSRRVLAEAAGSPLALVELGRELAAGRSLPPAI